MSPRRACGKGADKKPWRGCGFTMHVRRWRADVVMCHLGCWLRAKALPRSRAAGQRSRLHTGTTSAMIPVATVRAVRGVGKRPFRGGSARRLSSAEERRTCPGPRGDSHWNVAYCSGCQLMTLAARGLDPAFAAHAGRRPLMAIVEVTTRELDGQVIVSLRGGPRRRSCLALPYVAG
jgi:hypothetical protein